MIVLNVSSTPEKSDSQTCFFTISPCEVEDHYIEESKIKGDVSHHLQQGCPPAQNTTQPGS